MENYLHPMITLLVSILLTFLIILVLHLDDKWNNFRNKKNGTNKKSLFECGCQPSEKQTITQVCGLKKKQIP